MSGTAGTGPEIRPFRVTLRKNSSPTFGGASPRRAGPARRPSLTSPRVPSWRRSRNSCATGVLATTGGSSRAPHRTRPGPAGGSPSPQSAPNPRQPADGRSDTAVGTGGSRQSLARLSRRHPGGSRRAAGQHRRLSRLLRRPPARAPRTAVILMVHCRGLRWLIGPLSVSSWIRSAIGQSPGRSYA
jgi:hypothetical protein